MAGNTRSKKSETPIEMTDEIRALASRFTAEEIETGVAITGRPPGGGGHTADDIKEAYLEAVLTETIGEMFRAARTAEGQSLSGAAGRLGVSKGRVAQIEKPSANLRMATLQKTAESYGYKVRITLVPDDKNKQPIMAELPS